MPILNFLVSCVTYCVFAGRDRPVRMSSSKFILMNTCPRRVVAILSLIIYVISTNARSNFPLRRVVGSLAPKNRIE